MNALLLAAALADLILQNGNVVTGDAKQPRARAVAIGGDRLLFVGSDAAAQKLKGPNTRVIDLKGATVLPGLIDAHAHVEGLGVELDQLSFTGTTSFEQVVAAVQGKVAGSVAGAWVSGAGWDQNDWAVKEFPTHAALSAISPDNPVALSRIDGHALLLNAKAMELAGIKKDTPEPAGGKILRGKDGEPTGVLIDGAMLLVAKVIPVPTVAESKTAILRAQAECFRLGLTGVHDMGVTPRELTAYGELVDEGKLQIRINAYLDGSNEALVEERLRKKPETRGPLTVGGVKFLVDGALGSRGAAMIADYSDEKGNRGLLRVPADQLERHTARALKAGWQIAVHAIGDLGNKVVLDSFEKAIAVTNRPGKRPRIEHAQVIAPEDLKRFAKLDVIASMQPTHATSDMPWAEARVGAERIRGAYAWHTLLKSGARIAAGSDFPVEGPNPLWGFYAAITRQDQTGKPEGGWRPEERMTREEALGAFTTGAAFASFSEKDRGTVTKGKLADLTVLDKDVMTIPPAAILETKTVMTLVGGKIVHSGEIAAPGVQ